MAKGIGITDELQTYLVDHGSTPPDAVLSRLAAQTIEAAGPWAQMQIAPEQGSFMTWMTQLTGARLALEIGTFTGYSAICIARGLADDGNLTTLDISDKWTAIATEAWREAGLADRIELKLGPAAETLAAIPAESQFDIVFIDANKDGYQTYVDLVYDRLRPGGVVLVDNVLQGGAVTDENAENDQTQTMRAFNAAQAQDSRWATVMLPISDGLTLLRKL